MDVGHYNCRDYSISPHFAATTITSDRSPLYRHESFDELEQRSRSPASLRPKFPLLKLPLELRQQIFRYLLPSTLEHTAPSPLANHVRNFSAVKKRAARGMLVPNEADPAQRGPSNVVWQRGNIKLLSVCRQMHDECAELLYGGSTFLLFVTYLGITFRFSWLYPSGQTPNRRFEFLELLPKKYLPLIKRVVVNVDHVDSYTGMIKFNVSGKGLTHGLRKQVARLVNALQPPSSPSEEGNEYPTDKPGSSSGLICEDRRLTKLSIRISNGNAYLDQIKADLVRQREGGTKVSEDLEEMLEPFGDLRGVREVHISGAVTEAFASSMKQKMMSLEKLDATSVVVRGMRDIDLAPPPQMCVYGNDMT